MGFFMDVAQSFNAVVGIDLGGRKTAMAKKLFYSIQLCPIAGEMGGKTMAQNMGTFFVCSSHQREVFLYDIIDLTGSMRFLLGSQQQLGEYCPWEIRVFLCLKSNDLVYKFLVQGNDPLFITLAQHFQLVPEKVYLAGF